ncbi:hypothetical protein AZE42_05298 [Rhizopogon vesiculosus]|uniref:Uncharacterized protein n=1 Tax=Rhizopogon vesiculosus TaxID=180088 RepID=A0A1J8Q954_9AGAM|nr:hypothetical protein AZE42_05298 [Rhizopogon vesiculosus]
MSEENNLQKKRSIPQWWSDSRRGKSLLSVFNEHKRKVESDVVGAGGGNAESNSSVSEGNPGQDGDSGVRSLDLKLVNQRFADASEGLRNMERVTGSARGTASIPNKADSVLDQIKTTNILRECGDLIPLLLSLESFIPMQR